MERCPFTVNVNKLLSKWKITGVIIQFGISKAGFNETNKNHGKRTPAKATEVVEERLEEHLEGLL